MFDKLHDGNFLLYSAHYYNNPQCFDTIEFYEDINRFKYLKRLFKKYNETGDIKERLIINHIVILNNVFGPEATVRMLFYKLHGYEIQLKPFLLLIGIMPEQIKGLGIEGTTINSSEIISDMIIVNKLRKI